MAFAEREVTCSYCKKVQPNPAPLPPGHEVIVAARTMSDLGLGRVVSSTGPDAIEVLVEDKAATCRLEDLTPVLPLADGLRKGSRVFFNDESSGWYPSALVRIDDAICVVKHANESFQDSFFDKKVPRSRVRQPVRAVIVKRGLSLGSLTDLPAWAAIPLFLVGLALYVALSQLMHC